MTEIQLTIDGQQVRAPQGATLLAVARQVGERVPVICYHELTTPEGLCRQCVVEVEGRRLLAPACVTAAEDGMVVHTQSERVQRARRTILEMLAASVDLSDAPEIQEQMETYAVDLQRFPQAQKRGTPVIDDNPFYVRDYEKCIQCWRCVQACADDLQFTYALAIGGRGFESHITTFFDKPMPETTCVFCGNCVGVCPTGALKGKGEFLFQQGYSFEEIRAATRRGRGKKKRAGNGAGGPTQKTEASV
jgi:NADH dehydrogenase/NADH:ubiquinone oxidoreductase subunit G